MIERTFTKEQLENFKRHKYVSCGYSKLEQILEGFWDQIVKHMPSYISPNMCSFFGLFMSVSPVLLMMTYDQSFTQDLPREVYLLAALCIFVAQTMDNVDGKLARKTGRTSPLGQIVDHGLDSISDQIQGVAALYALKLGSLTPLYFLLTVT